MKQAINGLFMKVYSAKLECFEYTGKLWLTQIKFLVTFTLYLIPEYFFLFMFSHALKSLGQKNLSLFLFFFNITKFIYGVMTWPAETILNYYIKRGTYHENIKKIWNNPFVPYSTLYQYKDHFGLNT